MNSINEVEPHNQWTQDKIRLLKALVQRKLNTETWSDLAKRVPGRSGKDCKDKWAEIATKRKWHVEEFI
jgi:diketogulonate reductase-like aldo/keto reductase